MTTTDINKSMDGIGTNPGLLIRAPDYVSQGTEIVYSNSYLDGRAVRGLKRGQKLFETPWFKAGTLQNIVVPAIYIEGAKSVTGMSIDADNRNDKLKIIIYKRLPSERDTITSTSVYTMYNARLTNKIGGYIHAEQFYRPAWQPTWFDIRYEYKFAVEVHTITEGAALDVEGMHLQYHNPNTVMGGRTVTFGTGGFDLAIPVMLGVYWTATTDVNGNLSIAIPSEYFPYNNGWTIAENSTQGSLPTSIGPPLRGILNSVDAMHTTFVDGPDIDAEYMLWNYQVDDTANGGYTMYIGLHSDNPNTQYTFFTSAFGYVAPLVV